MSDKADAVGRSSLPLVFPVSQEHLIEHPKSRLDPVIRIPRLVAGLVRWHSDVRPHSFEKRKVVGQ